MRNALSPRSRQLVSKLYYRLFSISLELKRDYSTFYEVEYATFEQYLRKRHLLNKEDAAELSARYAKAAAIIRFGWLIFVLSDVFRMLGMRPAKSASRKYSRSKVRSEDGVFQLAIEKGVPYLKGRQATMDDLEECTA
jgi:hypothetical protein